MTIIFVGGTGRCGKSVVAECLAQHPDAIKLPFELRFLTDPDGLVDFYTSSLASWSPFLADRRIKRLGRFLTALGGETLSLRTFGGYIGWRLSDHLPNWYLHVEALMQSLYQFSYSGKWVGMTCENEIYHAGPPDKEMLAHFVGSFARAVIGDFLAENDKSIFISDDTWSILFAKELSELLPEAKFIHVYRDPRDVVSSMSKQRWCPSDLEQTTKYYLDLITRIELIEPLILHHVKFEDAIQLDKSLQSLCFDIGIKFDKAMHAPLDPDVAHIGRWKDEPDQEMFKLLQRTAERFGYE